MLNGVTSLPMRSMFFWTWGTHCLRTANSSGMVVLGSRRTSLHCGSLGSKKENSGGGEREKNERNEFELGCNSPFFSGTENPKLCVPFSPVYAHEESMCKPLQHRRTLIFCNRLFNRFNQITNLGKCPCCACRGERNQMWQSMACREPNEALENQTEAENK